jgi:hypothetical protein
VLALLLLLGLWPCLVAKAQGRLVQQLLLQLAAPQA